MKTSFKAGMLAAAVLGLSLAACDSPQENAAEDRGDALENNVEATADAMEDNGQITDQQADNMEDRAEATADAMEDNAEQAAH